MMQLICKENNLEYTGSGFLQCRKDVECPKKENNRILGFDCIAYIDNIPNLCKIDIPEQNSTDNLIKIHAASVPYDHTTAGKRHTMHIVPASEQVE
jgi:hypothetical protein